MDKTSVKVFIAYLAISVTTSVADDEIPGTFSNVANYVGVPEKILYSVALRESGRSIETDFEPWPWTLNIAGKGVYYDSRVEMFDALMFSLQSGITSVDIGPMQTNWAWQFDRIVSPWQITDPTYNTKVGAEILRELYEKTGDWWIAVGKYHRASDEPQHKKAAEEYAIRVKKTWGDL